MRYCIRFFNAKGSGLDSILPVSYNDSQRGGNMELTKLPQALLPWFEEKKRPLPWRQDRQPYHIWLSEIMLQQTRGEAVKG